MFAKVFLIGFLAVFALQGTVEARTVEVNSSMSRAERGIVDTIKALFEKLAGFVSGVIKQAVDLIGKLADKLVEIGGTVVENAKEILKGIIAAIKDKIQQLVDEAEAIGINISNCVKGQNEALDALYQQAIDGVTGCVESKIEGAKQIIDDATVKINKFVDQIAALKDKFVSCDGFVCYLGVATEAYTLISTIPGLVESTVKQVTALVETVINEVPTCVGGVADDVKASGEKILTEVIKCSQETRMQHFLRLH